MFSTFKQKLLLGLYIFLLVSIPLGAYLASQRQTIKSSASEETDGPTIGTTAKKSATSSAKQNILDLAKKKVSTPSAKPTSSPEPEASTTTIATNFGPTLSLSVKIEGRSKDQSTNLFVGIIEGSLSTTPKYILNFSVKIPSSGQYSGLSLAGLTPGKDYTALVKGQAQLAKAVSFAMAPNETRLNSGTVISLISGDLNEDNTINSTDLGIMKSALGSNSKSTNWNQTADINLDGVVNIIDYSILYNNMGKSGDSGTWVSPIPSATGSAQLKEENIPAIGSPDLSQGYQPAVASGYWIWLPR